MSIQTALAQLEQKLAGELRYDTLIKTLYATDASVYRHLPLAVAFPKHAGDLNHLVTFAKKHRTGLIPRTAGTSLAGQCVGSGIVVDVSKYFSRILHFDPKKQTITVQPGVVRDILNKHIEPYNLFFAPNTSTSNRCMIGGMVGNNSSGTSSIQYGVTRDKILEMHTILSDGSTAIFGEITTKEFIQKTKLQSLEGKIYRTIYDTLSVQSVQKNILAAFPKPEIHRRNTGYAIDELIHTEVFSKSKKPFNMCKLLAGSEGTLALTTQVTLKLDPLPPKHSVLVACHFETIAGCLKTVVPAMNHNLYSCEMMDKTILDCTKHNKVQQTNRQFIEGDPQAILMCEVRATTLSEAKAQANALISSVTDLGYSYASPKLTGNTINQANELRRAGLGLLGNIIGDKKGVACIEDTAVALSDLSDYIVDFEKLMKKHQQKAIYYAHAGAGELHLRPLLNLKKQHDVQLFRKLTTEVAQLVKRYGGAISGEHGDGIVRSEFIASMIGAENYNILKRIKTVFDRNAIFNPGKIIDPYPMDQSLRYKPDREEPAIATLMDFSKSGGILRAVEKCNGSGDCRKNAIFGGVMCPSYRATRREDDSTRGRANALREFLTHSDKINRFDHKELAHVFDRCLSCKACVSECPSSVDVASLKMEFLYQYQKENGISWRTKCLAYNDRLHAIGGKIPRLTNAFLANRISSFFIKKILGIAPERTLPLVAIKTLSKLFESAENQFVENTNAIKTVYIFNDEFTNHLDAAVGWDAIRLLKTLNYNVRIINHKPSGRALMSKGLLAEAQEYANENVRIFGDKISAEMPLVGIEPSAILSFKDEYLRLVADRSAAEHIAKHTFLIEEFIAQEMTLGNIRPEQFTDRFERIRFHGHCHQKALRSVAASLAILQFPKHYQVADIPSGCCGMAGSFGYEKAHYEISMKIGEQTLFPAVREASEDTIIAANGTSCRTQIKAATGRVVKHPVSVLYEALREKRH